MAKRQATSPTSLLRHFFQIGKWLFIALAGTGVILILLLILLFSLGSSSHRPTRPQTTALTEPTKAERIAEVSRILQRKIALPSAILDAHFDEIVVGGEDTGIFSGMGPVDYISYMHLKVAPADIEQWTALLKRPLEIELSTSAPKEAYPWWVDATHYPKLDFFEPQPLSFRNGWVAISRETGEIWVYGFTT